MHKKKDKIDSNLVITHVIFDLIGNDFQNQVMTYLWFEIRIKH